MSARSSIWTLSAAFGLALAGAAPVQTAQAQTVQSPSVQSTVPEKLDSTGSTGTLSEKLERSDGVIKPRGDIDPGITTAAPVPNPGTTPVIPPPGSPGGNPSIQPK